MQGDEARIILGFSPNSRPTLSQIKEAYKKKVWGSHPDLFPANEKPNAESRFKSISEAYSLLSGTRRGTSSYADSYVRVVRREVYRENSRKGIRALVGIPFLFIILGTVGLAGFQASRAYKKQKEAYQSHNPFLP